MRIQPEYKTILVRELREQQTKSEALLWQHLRGRKIGSLKFRRQRPIDRYIADFCCDEIRLIVEIDGSVHDQPERQETDAERQDYLLALGYTVLRFSADEVMNRTMHVLKSIHATALSAQRKPEPDQVSDPPLPAAGEGQGVRAGKAEGNGLRARKEQERATRP